MSDSDRERWDARYAARAAALPAIAPATSLALHAPQPSGVQPDEWLCAAARDLASGHDFVPGRALELACGLGHNAIWLAQQGWQVDAVDISPVGLMLAEQAAISVGVPSTRWIAADLDAFQPDASVYDLVVVTRFLERERLPGLIESALRPGGWLLYETFLASSQGTAAGPVHNPKYMLQADELPRLMPLTCVHYSEVHSPERSVARLIARKPL